MDGGTPGVSTIANYVRECLRKLKHASASYEEANVEIKEKLLNGSISDQAGRFRLWSSNIGAHQLGRSSLDYRLREASHIKDQILDLLREYIGVLDETVDIIKKNRPPWEDSSDMQSECSGDEDFLQSTTELEQLVSNMADINTSLMHLSVAIRNPAPHDQFIGSRLIDISHFEDRDIDHVCSKFKLAQKFLQQRLGKGISRRRQYLQYRKSHRSKLEHGIAEAQLDPHEHRATEETTVPLAKGESTVASSIPLNRKTWPITYPEIEMTAYGDTLSQTSYASSTQDASKLHPPPLPVAGRDGNPFECPLCYRFSSVKNTAAWRKHLYRDLQPYLCTFEDCRVADQMYESRNDWFDHELAEHRQRWECIEHCNLEFGSEEAFRLHLVVQHPRIGNGEQVVEFMKARRRMPQMDTEGDCALCGARLVSLIQLRRHLGRHLQELSLSAIPLEVLRADTDTEDNSIVDGESRSLNTGGFKDEALPTEFMCDVCQKTFSGEEDERLEALRIHMSEAHLDDDPSDTVIDPPSQVKEEARQQVATQTQEETRDIHEQAQPAQPAQPMSHKRDTKMQGKKQNTGKLAQPDKLLVVLSTERAALRSDIEDLEEAIDEEKSPEKLSQLKAELSQLKHLLSLKETELSRENAKKVDKHIFHVAIEQQTKAWDNSHPNNTTKEVRSRYKAAHEK
ncbi:hypothetical protein C7974DRAFT_97147 [Boeremia exigua]|uniref:uncharacterized protein n=1 Tax=Boeremia exigua TaxID=749465 RepID=UPI001E8E5048|nr:uncharacterized protein C7974DRAFT_97147 [Boeremia exigua]KAH6642193.1 hypothetical protein C7974DRAFT_97147 [Boeremia exigua]